MDSISDNALMIKVKDGDLEKLGLLFERYKKMLFGFFYNMTHDAGSSEDLVQNVFMRILKYRAGFKGDGEFKVWMFHVARNVSYDHFRQVKRDNTDEIELWQDKLDDHTLNEHDKIEKTEELELLKIAMGRLDTDKREVLTLSKLDGMKYKEIGDILDCSEGAVKVKVFRALQALKKEFLHLQTKV